MKEVEHCIQYSEVITLCSQEHLPFHSIFIELIIIIAFWNSIERLFTGNYVKMETNMERIRFTVSIFIEN